MSISTAPVQNVEPVTRTSSGAMPVVGDAAIRLPEHSQQVANAFEIGARRMADRERRNVRRRMANLRRAGTSGAFIVSRSDRPRQGLGQKLLTNCVRQRTSWQTPLFKRSHSAIQRLDLAPRRRLNGNSLGAGDVVVRRTQLIAPACAARLDADTAAVSRVRHAVAGDALDLTRNGVRMRQNLERRIRSRRA